MTTTTAPAQISENAQILLCKRYFWKKEDAPTCLHCGINHETLDEFFERVSLGNPEYRGIMESLSFLPNSPTLFNIGTGQGTLSACFKFDVEDNMESIMEVARKSAFVQKWGGGVGYYLGNLRPYRTKISTTHGGAMGPVGVLKHYHSVSIMITQAGKRDGAQMGILPIDHADIRDFIHVKDNNPQALSTFNISLSITDEWMKKVQDGEPEAVALFEEICESAWKTGDPGVFFSDAAERRNPTPWLGKLTGTNPCGEVPLLDNEPCNLGSINLSKFVKAGNVDFEGLEATAALATRYLDEVLDANVFPDPAIDKIARTTRKLGLGVMGWADMLALLGIDYESEGAIGLGEEVMGTIQRAASKASFEMGHEKGVAPAFAMDESDSHPNSQQRNVTVTCIAPTGSISLLAGASSGIEPHFALTWVRTMGDGTKLEEQIPVIREITTLGLDVPKTTNDIGIDWHVRHQAIFQRFTDLAVSKTINLPNHATPADIAKAYMQMWEMGCTGGTVFRDGSRADQVLDARPKEIYEAEAETRTEREKLPKTRHSLTHSFKIGGVSTYLTVGLYDDGRPAELFLTSSTPGGTLDGALDAFAISLSLALQQGISLPNVLDKLQGRRFEPSGFTDNPAIPNAVSIIDYIARWMQKEFLGEQVETSVVAMTGDVCPDCSSLVAREEGCHKCTNPSCGWSKC